MWYLKSAGPCKTRLFSLLVKAALPSYPNKTGRLRGRVKTYTTASDEEPTTEVLLKLDFEPAEFHPLSLGAARILGCENSLNFSA